MTLHNLTILIFLTLAFRFSTNGQGRVDSDPILHKIWWTTYKIDEDTSLKIKIERMHYGNGTKSFFVYFVKQGTLYKVVKLKEEKNGTEMTTSYFANNKPIFISISKNNFLLSDDTKNILKIISSFKNVPDTTIVTKKSLYDISYQAEYFFDKDKVRYSNVMAKQMTRVDNKNDIAEGLKLLDEAKHYLNMKQ